MRTDTAGSEGPRAAARSEVAAGLEELTRFAVRRTGTPRDISFTTASTLARLEHEGPRRLTSLAADEGVAQPSMTQLVQRLERQGLVERDRDPGDRRVVWVAITDAGRRLLSDRRTSRAQELAELLATLPPEDEAALAAAVLAALPVIRRLAERHAGATEPSEQQPITARQDR
jgi:DNA-binding MarR family transcriptional regulator